MATTDVNNIDNPRDADEAIYHQVLNCAPAIHPEEVEPLADLVMKKDRVTRQWRLTALIAGKDGEFFKDISCNADMAKTLAPCVGSLNDFSKLLRTMADLADCASARIAVAGCNHEHFPEWMNEEA